MMLRALVLVFVSAAIAPAWVESVEFPWNICPKPLWESQLVWLKNIGITHVSLPPAQDISQLTDVLRIIRALGIEADLEGPIPNELQPLTRAHGGPLTDPLPGSSRVSALSAIALTRARESLLSGAGAVLWTDVHDTLGPNGYRAGAVSFTGEERAATNALRRSAQLAGYWSATFRSLHALPGAGIQIASTAARVANLSVRQFGSNNGPSVVSVINKSARPWTGDLKVFYAAAKRQIAIPGVSVGAHDSMWLPVNVALTDGPLCKGCSAFGNADHLIYSTAEVTAIEYENGILAMEFAAPSGGEVVLQLSREPYGPFVAGGRPASFQWDDEAHRVRLKIPSGNGAGKHVRVGLAIEPPEETGFFDSLRTLMIGETNHLVAEFSSDAVAQRSRLRLLPDFPAEQQPGKEPMTLAYDIKVPPTAIHGDYANVAIEADAMQMSHARPRLLRPLTLRFPDAIEMHLASNSVLPLFPATVSLNQRAGGDLVVTVRNNAPEIRTFEIAPKADGLDFSPARMQVTVGNSTARDISFRVFANGAMPGLHAGAVAVTGAATATEPIQFVVYPSGGAIAFSASGFSILESAKFRASFMPGRWLEFINKENNQNLLMNTGLPFTAGNIDTAGDSLVFGDAKKVVRLPELEELAPKPKISAQR